MSGASAIGETVLACEDLGVRFGGLVALAQVSFEVRAGEVASLIGPNGAGKTTAFNAITGFLAPSAGAIHYQGRPLAGLRPNQIADLGVVRTFQKTSVFAANSVFDNLLIGLHRQGGARLWEILLALPRVRAEERRLHEQAEEILEFVGLSAHAGEPGGALPYGEQRLLEVAVALAAKPSLLLLDEPVSGMNPVETASFMTMLGKIRTRGITVLLVEHDMRMVMGVSDRVVVLNQGAIIAEGTPEEIQRDPEVIRAYLGQGAGRRGAGREEAGRA
jgi:branched-chain amino acid transport system ATP-binding protein